jgi:hypothetical protein
MLAVECLLGLSVVLVLVLVLALALFQGLQSQALLLRRVSPTTDHEDQQARGRQR